MFHFFLVEIFPITNIRILFIWKDAPYRVSHSQEWLAYPVCIIISCVLSILFWRIRSVSYYNLCCLQLLEWFSALKKIQHRHKKTKAHYKPSFSSSLWMLLKAYSHAWITKPLKVASLPCIVSSILAIRSTGKRIVLFSVSFFVRF